MTFTEIDTNGSPMYTQTGMKHLHGWNEKRYGTGDASVLFHLPSVLA